MKIIKAKIYPSLIPHYPKYIDNKQEKKKKRMDLYKPTVEAFGGGIE